MGPDGVRASWVQQENARPGTKGWEIAPDGAKGIEGFANRSYAAVGDEVTLYVSTRAAALPRRGAAHGLLRRCRSTDGLASRPRVPVTNNPTAR